MVDKAPTSKMYFSDGYLGYIDVVYHGKYKRNVRDKSDTFTVESINSNLRYYIPMLAGRNKFFARKLETLYAVLKVFICAYDCFGYEKIKYRKHIKFGEIPFSVLDFL